MVISRESAHEVEHLMFYGGIDELVYPGQRKSILWIGFIYISKVYTYTPFVIRLLDEDDIRQPIRVVYLMDEACR